MLCWAVSHLGRTTSYKRDEAPVGWGWGAGPLPWPEAKHPCAPRKGFVWTLLAEPGAQGCNVSPLRGTLGASRHALSSCSWARTCSLMHFYLLTGRRGAGELRSAI